ncbi:MAG TPA: VCBS repeat-containing protein [Aridibacter sp.]|nr:VCBS repeat-containing protein [Aridibacter sp.]
MESLGYNFIRDPSGLDISGDESTNIYGQDPLLGPLQDNGGFTPTRLPDPASPVVDAGDSGGSTIDQRGFPRPVIFNPPLGLPGDGADIGAVELQTDAEPAGTAVFDFDGDGQTDASVFRPNPAGLGAPEGSTSQWWILRSSDLGNAAYAFGAPTDIPVPADFTGDGKADVAFWRPSTGEWFILRSEDSSFFAFPFGSTGDIPAPGDFDGDGLADPAVYRPSSATWFIFRSSDSGVSIVPFGVSEDLPVVDDYDGDGMDDVAIFRPSVNQYWQLMSSAGARGYQFGSPGDRTAIGDWTGDGKADVAFFRPSSSEWFIIRSEDDSFFAFPWGADGDLPAPGDYDGDGLTDPAVWRPSDQTWYIFGSTNGFEAVLFGAPGDVPIPSTVSVQ